MVIMEKKLRTIIFSAVSLSTLPSKAMAATTGSVGVLGNLNFDKILTNISTTIEPLTQLTLAICFLAGVFFVFRGVAMLHTFGQVQYQMNKPHGITGPFIYIAIGAGLIYLPSNVSAATNTIFGLGSTVTEFFDPSSQITFASSTENGIIYYKVTNTPRYETNGGNQLLGYFNVAGGQEWEHLIDVVVQFIQFVGLIAFVRGWFILSHIANGSGAQQNSFSKGLIHIIGGIASINFMPFMQVISALLFS